MKSILKRILSALSVIFMAFMFFSCSDSSESDSKVYICETVENGTDVTYSLSFKNSVATLLRQTPISFNTFKGTISKKSDKNYILSFPLFENNPEIPSFLEKIEISLSGTTFTFIGLPDSNASKTPPSSGEQTNPGGNESSSQDTNNPGTSEPENPSEPVIPLDPVIPVNPGGEDNPSEPVCTHESVRIEKGVTPTCTENGFTDKTYCADCGAVIKESEIIPASGHEYKDRVCSRCGDIYLYGIYRGTPEHFSTGDVTVYLSETSENSSLTLSADNNFLFTESTVLTETYPAEIKIYDGLEFLKNLTTTEEIQSPEAPEHGFTEEKYFSNGIYKLIYKRTIGNITESFIFESDTDDFYFANGFYVKETITEESSQGTFSFDKETLTVSADNGTSYLLNLKEETFLLCLTPLTVTYYVNNSEIKTHIFPDNTADIDMLAPLSDNFSNLDWYVSPDASEPYNAGLDCSAVSEFSLYAFIEYSDTFYLGDEKIVLTYDDYENVASFGDVEKLLLKKCGIITESAELKFNWTENDMPVSELTIPSSRYELKSDRNFTLKITPFQDRKAVYIFDTADNVTFVYTVDKAIFEKCTDVNSVIDLLNLSQSDKINYTYTAEENLFSLTRTFVGITVTYIYGEEEFTEKVSAYSSYMIGENFINTTWFGEDSVYEKGDEIILTEPITFYSLRFTVWKYDGSTFISETYNGKIPENLETAEMESFEFCGFFVNDEPVDYYKFPQYGNFTVTALYSKTTVEKTPSEIEEGILKTVYRYAGGEYSSSEPIPELTKEIYDYEEIIKPTLLTEGLARYSSDKYGTYEVMISVLTTETFSCNGITYTVTLHNETDATVSYENKSYSAKISKENGQIIFTNTNTDTAEQILYAVSVNGTNGFSIKEVTSYEEAYVADLPVSDGLPVNGTTYFSYEKSNNLFISESDCYKIVDENFIATADYYDNPYMSPEPYENYYVQSGLYISFVNGIVYYSKDPSNLPAGETDVNFENYSGAPAYKVTDGKKLYLNGTEYELTTSEGKITGTAEYDTDRKRIYLLSGKKTEDAPEKFVYRIENGKPIIEMK